MQVSEVLAGLKKLDGPEGVRLQGQIDLVLRNALGLVKEERSIRNLIVSAGKAGVASRINGSGAEAAFTWIAIGTGATAPAAGNTALQTEITNNGGARANGTASRVTTTVTDDTAQVVVTFNFTGAFAVTEAGLLNASSAGTLLARQTFAAVNVANGDSLQVTWRIAAS